jgi:hypothetical protein
MDSENLSETIIRELGELFVATLTEAGPALLQGDLDGIEQRLQDLGRRVLGKAVEAIVTTIGSHAAPEAPRCACCQQSMRRVDRQRLRQLQGLVGDYDLRRAYFICDACHQGRAPLDERLGLGPGALSPGLARVACRLGIEDSFGETADALHETLRVDVAREAIRRITEGIGQVAEDEEQAAIRQVQVGYAPRGETTALPRGAALLVEVDGAQVHLEDDWHEAKVGLAAPLGPTTTTNPDTGRETLVVGKPCYCAGFESAETFWYRVYVEAWRQGLGSVGVALIVVVGDGADWIWRYAARFLAGGTAPIVEIVDIYHAWEHLGTVAAAVFGSGSAAAAAWVEPLKATLLTAGAAPIRTALRELAPPDPPAAEEVRKALGYFTTHAARMNYPQFIAQHLPIGSGAVESSCKTLIEERAKGAGMRWLKQDAQAVVSLRALWRSGHWQAFWATHPQCRRAPVFPRRGHAETEPQEHTKQAA